MREFRGDSTPFSCTNQTVPRNPGAVLKEFRRALGKLDKLMTSSLYYNSSFWETKHYGQTLFYTWNVYTNRPCQIAHLRACGVDSHGTSLKLTQTCRRASGGNKKGRRQVMDHFHMLENSYKLRPKRASKPLFVRTGYTFIC